MDIKTFSEWIGAIVGVGALLGGVAKAISFVRPPKIIVSAPERIGVVISVSGTTPSIHLPLIISNRAKRETIVTLLSLNVRSENSSEKYNFEWRLMWTQDNYGNRLPAKDAIPIPISGLSSVEANIQFDSNDMVKWKPQPYEVTLCYKIEAKRKAKEGLRFFIHPIEARCKVWYAGPYAAGPWVDNLPIYLKRKDIPTHNG